jgi:hypothetical protein
MMELSHYAFEKRDKLVKMTTDKIETSFVVILTLTRISLAVLKEMLLNPNDIWGILAPKRRILIVANPDY